MYFRKILQKCLKFGQPEPQIKTLDRKILDRKIKARHVKITKFDNFRKIRALGLFPKVPLISQIP